MAVSPKHRGWRHDAVNGRLQAMYDGVEVFDFDSNDMVITPATTVTGALTAAGGVGLSGRGTVTQASNHSTGVTINATSGTITLASADLSAGAEANFVVTNNQVAATDVVVVSVGLNNDASGTPAAVVGAVGAGQFTVTLTNLHASTAAFNDASTINFAVIKSVT